MYKQCREIINNKKNMMKLYICLTNGEIKLKNNFIKNYIKCSKSGLSYCKNI